MNRDNSSFLRLHPSTTFQTLLLTMTATPFLLRGSPSTVVDIMVIWVKFTHSSLSSLSPRMLTFTLAISCLTTSNLPWFMDLTFQVPMQYCSLQHRILLLSPVPFTTGCCFCFGSIPSFFLELFLHWSPVAYWATYRPGEFIFQCPIFLPFHTVYRDSQGKNTEVVCHSLLQWTTFCQTSPPWPHHPGWPHTARLSFIELEKAVVHVIRLTSFLWFGFNLSALWCPLETPTVLLGYLLPWSWGLSSRQLQQSSAAAPSPERGVAPLGHTRAPSQLPRSCVVSAFF